MITIGYTASTLDCFFVFDEAHMITPFMAAALKQPEIIYRSLFMSATVKTAFYEAHIM